MTTLSHSYLNTKDVLLIFVQYTICGVSCDQKTSEIWEMSSALSALSCEPTFLQYTTDGFSIQYFTVVQGSQILYTPNQTSRGGIFCNHTPCLSHLLTFKCGHLMRVQIRQQLP